MRVSLPLFKVGKWQPLVFGAPALARFSCILTKSLLYFADGNCSEDVILGTRWWPFYGPQAAQGGLEQGGQDRCETNLNALYASGSCENSHCTDGAAYIRESRKKQAFETSILTFESTTNRLFCEKVFTSGFKTTHAHICAHVGLFETRLPVCLFFRAVCSTP